MKKKITFLILLCCFLLVGCGRVTEKDVTSQLAKKIEKSKGYNLSGKMEIINNEDTYEYEVNVSYKKGDYFKVYLKNMANNHEQIILRNKDGVYVVTPSLNKSFKFQSEWPYNNSQVYLLQSIVDDIKDDEGKKFQEKGKFYVITSKVNYPNNRKLSKQVVYVDKNYNIKEVQVLDDSNNLQIKMVFDKIDMKATFKDNYFDLNENINASADTSELKEVTKIEDIIYPMYLPLNTHLTSKDTVTKEDGERLILTFEGDSPFVLIEETAKMEDSHVIVPTYGEPELLVDTVASISNNSVNWVSNGIEYYVISDVTSTSELLQVARSISTIPVSK